MSATRSSSSPFPQRNPQIERAIEEAQLLLAFAARNGIVLDEAIIATVVKARADDSVSDDEEATFWSRFNQLAKAVAPVTAESLRAMHSHHKPGSGWTWPWVWWRRISQARRTVLSYTYVAAFSLIVLLTFQYFWAQGTYLALDLQRIDKRFREVETQIMTIEKMPRDGQAQKSLDLHFLKMEQAALIQQKHTNLDLIRNWRNKLLHTDGETSLTAGASLEKSASVKLYVPSEKPVSQSPYPESPIHAGLLQKLTLELEAIQGYILPLLYGLLGACVYILRSLAGRIKTHTYTEIANINLKIRLFLGMLGGMVIAWFVTPENSGGLFKSLSPFALAFLAGYSIELLFASMDRIIGAFTGNAPTSSAKSQ